MRIVNLFQNDLKITFSSYFLPHCPNFHSSSSRSPQCQNGLFFVLGETYILRQCRKCLVPVLLGFPQIKITFASPFLNQSIWRMRNPTGKRFTFCENHISGYIQHRLDFFFVSNKSQESIKNTDIFVSLSTDHSPIFFTLR